MPVRSICPGWLLLKARHIGVLMGRGRCRSMQGPDQSKFFTRNLPVELEYHSELCRGDSVIASTRFRRHFGDGVIWGQVHEPPVVGTFAHPNDGLPHPGVLVLHGSDSVDLASAATLLASEAIPFWPSGGLGSRTGLLIWSTLTE